MPSTKPVNGIRILTLLAASAAVGAGCGEDSIGASEPASAQPAETARQAETAELVAAPQPGARRRGPLVKLRRSQFGPVIFSGRDRAAYAFTRDAAGRSRCYGKCAQAWPPFYARANPRAGRGVRRSLLGTVRRRGGRRQVTYADHPLYFYVHDPKGKVFCNDVTEYGGTWFAVTASGKPPT